jgi:hypothetical protein
MHSFLPVADHHRTATHPLAQATTHHCTLLETHTSASRPSPTHHLEFGHPHAQLPALPPSTYTAPPRQAQLPLLNLLLPIHRLSLFLHAPSQITALLNPNQRRNPTSQPSFTRSAHHLATHLPACLPLLVYRHEPSTRHLQQFAVRPSHLHRRLPLFTQPPTLSQ